MIPQALRAKLEVEFESWLSKDDRAFIYQPKSAWDSGASALYALLSEHTPEKLCNDCMDLGSFCKAHDFSKSLMDSEAFRQVLLDHKEPYDSDSMEIAFMRGVKHGRSGTVSKAHVEKMIRSFNWSDGREALIEQILNPKESEAKA